MSRGAVAAFSRAKIRRSRSTCWAWIPDVLPVSKNRRKPLCLNPRITRSTVTYLVTECKTPEDRGRTSRNRGRKDKESDFSARIRICPADSSDRNPPIAIVSVSTAAQKAETFSANSARIPDRVLVSTCAANRKQWVRAMMGPNGSVERPGRANASPRSALTRGSPPKLSGISQPQYRSRRTPKYRGRRTPKYRGRRTPSIKCSSQVRSSSSSTTRICTARLSRMRRFAVSRSSNRNGDRLFFLTSRLP
jgi:hypothetical protein